MDCEQHESDIIQGLKIGVDIAIPFLGDEKTVRSTCHAEIDAGYEISLVAGESLRWLIELRRISEAIEVSGSVEGNIELECCRCLERFDFPLNLNVWEHALCVAEEDQRDSRYLDEYQVVGGELDLLPIIRDAICLAIPTKRLCSEHCRGLCPVCGANLNLGLCNCSSKPVDARLKPLLELKRRLER
ncbi:MAG: DUF177 domain-containing protein [Actinomycetota bacterium]|nr:DUF177 domain-containing protein [Actinomycetota bacterium]